MKRTTIIFVAALFLSAMFTFILNNASFQNDYLTALGLTNLIVGGLLLLTGLIAFAFNANIAKAFLAAGGLLLLAGGLLSAAFPVRYNK